MMKYFLLPIVLVGFVSCSKDKVENVEPVDCVNEISFSSDVVTILNTSCATSGCHNQSSAAAGYAFTTYESVEQNKDIILRTMEHEQGVTPMPIGQPKLNRADIDKFYCWIEQGAPNN